MLKLSATRASRKASRNQTGGGVGTLEACKALARKRDLALERALAKLGRARVEVQIDDLGFHPNSLLTNGRGGFILCDIRVHKADVAIKNVNRVGVLDALRWYARLCRTADGWNGSPNSLLRCAIRELARGRSTQGEP